jgi:hypothetical protein
MKTVRNVSLPTLAALAVLSGSVMLAGAGQQPAPVRGPAPSLVRPTSAPKASDRAGFLQRWLILEPIRVAPQLTDNAVQAVVKKEYFPNQFTVIPHDGDTMTVGGEAVTWHAVDTVGYNVNLFHFAHALDKNQHPTSCSGP